MQLEQGAYISNLIQKNCGRPFFVGLCTGWNMSEIYKDVDVDVIGTLYTKNGAKLMLRNIFANPKFKALIVVDTNLLGQNNTGKHGLKLIHDIFFGTDEERKNISDQLQYDINELQRIVVYYIRNVIIHVHTEGHNYDIEYDHNEIISTCSIDIINQILKNIDHQIDPIMRPQIIYSPDTMSSSKYIQNEYLGVSIRGSSLFDAWFQVLNHVYKYGCMNESLHEYHSIHWNFPIDNMDETNSQIRKILVQCDVQQMIGIDQQSLDDYSKTMNENIIASGSSYTYGSRLHLYKGRMQEYLKKNAKTRYAFGTTILYDVIDKQAPCMVYVQLLYDNANNKLNLYVIFRSHDIFKAALANGYALCKMLQEYSVVAGVMPGRVEITSLSAHIYDTDLNNTKLFIDCISAHMKDTIHFDPRGNFVITKTDEFVICELHDGTDDKILITLKGKPFDIYKKILDEKIVVDTEHLSYIFAELFKQ